MIRYAKVATSRHLLHQSQIPKLTVFGLRIFQRYLLKSEHPVYLWLLAFDVINYTSIALSRQVKLV